MNATQLGSSTSNALKIASDVSITGTLIIIMLGMGSTIEIHSLIKHVGVMVFNATFNNKNNISFILWRSVLLVEEIGVPGENHRPAAIH
jgi:hypothetical protein